MISERLAEAKADLERQKTHNDEILQLLATMEHLWPEDEKWKIRALAAQAETTKSVLQLCSERLEKIS